MKKHFIAGIIVLTLLVTTVGVSFAQDNPVTAELTLNGDSISISGNGVMVDGSRATITSAGTYRISGNLTDGQIVVDTEDEETVTLILNGVDIQNSTTAPINVVNAEETVITLANNTENYVSDAAAYVYENAEEDEPNAAIFSKDTLTFNGNGTLTVNGNYNDGIASKDTLTIASGVLIVNAVDDGIRGKDSLTVQSGMITVNAGGDGLKSDNDEDTTKGVIIVETGVINIISGGDAIQAETVVAIAGGELTLVAGGGSNSVIGEDDSAKGIKASVNITINGGILNIDSADDAVNSNASVVVNGGVFVISTGDDGLHADANLDINGGEINIANSYEGIESAIITVNGGNIHIVASDDGLNVAGGTDNSGVNAGPGRGGQPGRSQRPGQENFAATGTYFLYMNGGYIAVTAAGDGVDVNGSIVMTGGTILVHGPTENMNGPLDYDGSFTMAGGFFVAAGSAGMVQAPDQSSTQNSVLIIFDSPLASGTLIRVQSSEGTEILTFVPSKQYQSILISTPALVSGTTYEVYLDGSSSGAAMDGLYQGGTYSAGSQYTSFTISNIVTQLGNRMR